MYSPFTDFLGSEEKFSREDFEEIMFRSPFAMENRLSDQTGMEDKYVEEELRSYETIESQVAPDFSSIKIGDVVFTVADSSTASSQDYGEPVASGNKLLIIQPKDRSLHISKNFLAGEFAQAQAGKYKFNFLRIDPLLVDNLQRLRSFFGRSIEIIDGYYSPKYLKEVLRIKDQGQINRDPHITGRSVKINIPGYAGLIKQVAIAAIVTCDKDVNIGIGSSTMTLSLNQGLANVSGAPHEDFQRITSYIADEKIKVAAYTFCVDVKRILYSHFSAYENPMQKAVSALAVTILKFHYHQSSIPADWSDWVAPIKNIISLMYDKSLMKNPDVILYCLAYSPFGYLYRYFLKEKSEITTVNYMINDLTSDSDRQNIHVRGNFISVQNDPDKTVFIDYCRQRILVGKKRDGSKYHLAPATFFDWKDNPQDKSFFTKLEGIIKDVFFTNRYHLDVPAQQSPEGGTSRNLKLADPDPDKPVKDLTGRYWAPFPASHPLHGRWLLINQAGNYISGKLGSIPKKTGYTHLKNAITEFYGKMDANGNAICNLYPQQSLIVKTVQNVTRLYIVDNPADKITQNFPMILKSKNPVISNQVINSFSGVSQELLITLAWIPPLPGQLRDFFDSFRKSDREISEAISNYYNENETVPSVRDSHLNRYMNDLNSAVNNYLPLIFKQFVAYYTKYYYSVSAHWKPRDDREAMSKLNWIKRMLQDFRDLARPGHVEKYFKRLYDFFGIDTRIPDAEYYYIIKIKLTAFGIGPFARSSGTITIENKTDFSKYPKMEKWTVQNLPITLWNATLSLNPGKWLPKVSAGQTIEAELKTNIYYSATDFSGGEVQITEGKVFEIPLGGSSGGVKASTKIGYGGVVILIDGHGKKTLEFNTDLSLGLPDTVEIEPSEPSAPEGTYEKIAGFLPSLTMYKGSIGTKTTSLDIISVPLPESFATSYQIQNTKYFKHDDATLSPQAIEAVGKMCAEELVAFSDPKSEIEIYGHTDASGDPGYNLKLSRTRASNVWQAIKDRLNNKLNARLKKIEGLGERDANQKYGQFTQKNAWLRRVVVVINGRAVLSLGEI